MKVKTENLNILETKLITYWLNTLTLKAFPPQEVNWERYARQYDAVTIELKQSYRKILSLPLLPAFSDMMNYHESTLVCDLGAGTGNFSIPMAKANPHLRVAHNDFDETFIGIAQQKAAKQGLTNMDFHKHDAENIREINTTYGRPFDAVFMIHSLYSMRSKEDMGKPQRVLSAVYECLSEGGHFFIADIEREMNLAHLIYDGVKSSIAKHGITRAIKLFKEMDQAKHQNANIIRNQRSGIYITQTIEKLKGMLEEAGFKRGNIKYQSEFEYYDGYDNVIVIMK